MKPSDMPPSMRQQLTMRDIEAERPAGAFRFRVTFPDGHANDYMTFDAAQQAAEQDQGRITRLSETQKTAVKGTKGGNPRVERILKMLRVNNPQAQNDLEALILDFRGQQAQDRSDILRLDMENDAEEADIERLEQMLAILKQRKGSAAVTEDDQDTEMQDFLARGGKIQQEPGRMPRLGARLRRLGSRHIGQGREPRAGQLTGRGANVNVRGGKPVVTAEGLQPGEYHVATVTLDDGSVKRVRITADEGFRDRIHRHFALQDREVLDIYVDYAVRSDLEEQKPSFTGAPARPQPQPVNPSSPMLPPAPGRPTMVNKPMQEAKKKPQPTNPELWSRAKAAARSKFDVWPSAYASAWAAKYYKSKGGGWRMGKAKKKD